MTAKLQALQITGNGTLELFAVTSTISPSGDQGADPNKLLKVTDLLRATSLPQGNEDQDGNSPLGRFVTISAARAGEVLRGVAFAPESKDDGGNK